MLEKYPSESAVFSVDCSALLADTETIIGTPVVNQYPKFTGDAALVITLVQVSTTPVTLPSGVIVAAGKLLSMVIAGGQSETDKTGRVYSLLSTFTTSAGTTLASKSLLTVLPVGPGV